MNDRHSLILKLVSREGEASVQNLSEQLDVSLVTIRSDLRQLEEQGLLTRTRGGAALSPEDDIARRMGIRYAEKQRIAAAAAALVEEGETIFLEAGSCIALMARELCSFRRLNVITNNAFVARQFRDAPGIRVILLGGEFQKDSETMVGPMIAEYLRFYHFDKAFMGMDGFTPEWGAMCRDIDRAQVMAEIAAASRELTILSDSSKFGNSAVRSFAAAGEITRIISDSRLSGDIAGELKGIISEIHIV